MRPGEARARHHALVAATLLLITAAVDARADTLASLGRLERESVEDALARLGLTIDPRPEGKRIGQVYVLNHEVFSQRDWRLQFFNVFHRTTRPDIIGRELLLRPGQVWDQALADESVRNLQSSPPLFFANGTHFAAPLPTGLVAIVPVVATAPGTVDLLAVTRDLWSLRFNTEFQFQRNALTMLRTSLSENNFLGWRKQLSAGFDLDQGRYGIGPSYFDPNLAGTRLTLLATATAWYGREADRYEGDSELFSLRYPLFSLASRWGAGLDVIHEDIIVRQFCDDQLCPALAAGTAVPLAYRRRDVAIDANVVRSLGSLVLHRVTAGYRLDRPRATVLPSFSADPAVADAFLAEWAPGSELRAEPYLRYELLTARYHVFRDLDTFDLRENRRLGPSLSLEAGAGLPTLGADRLAYPLGASASWAVAPGGAGYGIAQLQASARVRPGELIDQRLSAVLYFASPPIAGFARAVIFASTDVTRADSYRTRFFLGGASGLRGYQIGEFQGTVQVAAHAELRTLPLVVRSQRLGGVLFYDVGHAAESYGGLVPHHDIGVGLRWLIPQLNSSVLRIDWAIPTQAGPYTAAGFPGRISAGFMQSLWLLDSPKGYLRVY